MSARPLPATLLRRGWALAVLLGAALPAQAVSTRWQCTGYRPLEVDATPQEAHLHFEGQDWALRRQHDNGEARYVDSRHGVTLIMHGRTGALLHGDEHLACKLLSDALNPEGAPAPASAAASAPR